MAEVIEILVEPDTYQVSSEPVLLRAQLQGALALCLHDEGRRVGGLLHWRFCGASGRPADVTDSTLNSILGVLDRFKRAVIGTTRRRDQVHGRILAHALPRADPAEPSASLVDLLLADLAEAKIACGAQVTRRTEPMQVCFQPFEGRIWIDRGNPLRSAAGRIASR